MAAANLAMVMDALPGIRAPQRPRPPWSARLRVGSISVPRSDTEVNSGPDRPIHRRHRSTASIKLLARVLTPVMREAQGLASGQV